MINIVVVEGRLTRDADIQQLSNGRDMVKFRIANNSPYKKKDSGEWQENTSFFDVVIYGNDLKRLFEKLNKGTLVLVEGRLNQDVWEREDGSKASAVNIIAKKVSVIKQPAESADSDDDIEV